MDLYYFKSELGNFGDDLNPWLWEKLLGDFDDYKNDLHFVGIGSILDHRLNNGKKKVVFGSGVRSILPNIEKSNLDICFVRGPFSSLALNGVPYITDSAYCLNLLPELIKVHKKKYKCSVIPYFRHLNSFDWKFFEKITGIHFINITWPIDKVLKEISATENVICGAMHGAIACDILRIPWARLRFGLHGYESIETSNLKWKDWLGSMSFPSDMPYIDISQNKIHKGVILKNLYRPILFADMCEKLSRFKNFSLSEDEILAEKTEQLNNAVNAFKVKYSLLK